MSAGSSLRSMMAQAASRAAMSLVCRAWRQAMAGVRGEARVWVWVMPLVCGRSGG
ncbi:hypothetical protein D3C87_2184200 [compost metagenome]